MTTQQLAVESIIERSYGKAGGVGHERYDVRFWLSTTINGRKVDSRGTLVTVDKIDTTTVNTWRRGICAYVQDKIVGMDAKAANNVLAELVNEAITIDSQIDQTVTEISDRKYSHRNGETATPAVEGVYRREFRDGEDDQIWLSSRALHISPDPDYPKFYGPLPESEITIEV